MIDLPASIHAPRDKSGYTQLPLCSVDRADLLRGSSPYFIWFVAAVNFKGCAVSLCFLELFHNIRIVVKDALKVMKHFERWLCFAPFCRSFLLDRVSLYSLSLLARDAIMNIFQLLS